MKACVFTLGCKMNEAESASLMRGLEERGYEVTDELCDADLYLLNTCAVTAEAEKKSRQAIARMRKFNPHSPIYVCGCASERDAEAFLRKEGVVLVTGAKNKNKLFSLLDERGVFREAETDFCEMPYPERTKTRAYLRVQDGCNRFCSYCIIPYLRGRSRSRALSSAVDEAKACGAKEIVVTGIDLSSYRDGEHGLPDLVRALCALGVRVRLGSLETSAVTDDLLLAMKEGGGMPHFHLSLQSGSDAVLRAMNRKYTREEYLAACKRIYNVFPDAAVTTDIIAGYPTETEEDLKQSLSIIGDVGFARVHVFPFSAREGTVAWKLQDLPPEVKKERVSRLLEEAKRAEDRYLQRFRGREATVLFEREGGYTENYIRVYAEGTKEGELARVRLLQREQDGYRAEVMEVL